MPQPADIHFHGEFTSADASALSEVASRIALYPANSTNALTVSSGDLVVITDWIIQLGGASLTVTLYDGSDNSAGAGEQIYKGTFPANAGRDFPAPAIPHFCQFGTYPKVKTSAAGQVDVIVRGYVRRAAT